MPRDLLERSGTGRGLVFFVLVIGIGLSLPSTARSQVSPEEHRKHHPGSGKGGQPGQGGMMGGPGGMMGGKGGMMGGMGGMHGELPRELYPALMALPDLPAEKRGEILKQAHERMQEGVRLWSQGLDRLGKATESENYQAMQEATALMHEGLAQFESGLAAKRALAEGKAPKNVAMQWFRREMNLLPQTSSPDQEGVFGLSTFHFISMVLLTGFAAVMIGMYFFKMRRASALLEKLAMRSAETTEEGKPSGQLVSESTKQSASRGEDCCEDSSETCPAEAGLEDSSEVSPGLLPIRRKKLCRLRVARIDQETPNVKTFRFVACHGGGIPFSYLPGQFLTLTLPVGEKPIRRSYTISSSPTQGYYCEITVKREDHGLGSRYLHDDVKVGDTIEAQAPSGKFIFTGKESDSIALIAGGVGITPMMSVTQALTDMAWEREIYFIVACHDQEHFIFESELKRLQERHSNLHVFVAMSRIEQDLSGYRKGRLSRGLLAEWVPDIASRRIHLCGPPAMMDAVKLMLAELDVPAGNVHTENFGSQQKPQVRAEQREKSDESDLAETGGTVTFSKSGKSAQLLPDETILEAAERSEVPIDYSCRVGMCGVCTVKLLSGEVSMEVEDGLEPEDRDAGMILACQAKSSGNVEVEA